MVFVAGFIIVLGLFTHDWWVSSGQHTLFEEITQEETVTNLFAKRIGQGEAHAHVAPTNTRGLLGVPIAWGNWVLVFLWLLPIWWYYLRNKHGRENNGEQEDKQ
jgi:hypothetical protein